MINWSDLISRDRNAVINFAKGTLSAKAFQSAFSGTPNPARCIIRNHGITYGRALAKKALTRRKVSV